MSANQFATSLVLLVTLGLSRPAAAAELRTALTPHVPPVVRSLAALGPVEDATPLRLAIALPGRDPAGLNATLRELADPASPRYRHYLLPEEFAARYGASEQDLAAVAEFARTNGLTVATRHGNRRILSVTGTARAVAGALHVKFHRYQHPSQARTFFAPDREPALNLHVPVLHISGLETYSRPQPRLHAPSPAVAGRAQPRTGSGPGGTYRGYDFRQAYIPGGTLTGAGQSVALVEFDGYYASDIAAYASATGLPGVNLTNVAVAGGVGTPGDGDAEVSLDIEMAMAMAPGLANIYVYEAPLSCPWVTILSQIADDNLAAAVSCSWGGGWPDPASELVFQQMAAQGQSFFNASGDTDAFTGLIPFPSDSTNIVQVGGTTLTTGTAAAYTSERVWNWGAGMGSSGGVSTYYAIPSYQTGVNLSTNQGSTTYRNVPDVAMVADAVWVSYGHGLTGDFGGTSCAAPLWAAFTALANQQAAALGQPPVGFLNPALYALGTSALFPLVFHDTVTGDNTSSASPTNYYAVPGYDLATGWGTPNGMNLINALVAGITNVDATPVLSPAPAHYYTNPVVTLTSVTAGATIRFTLDGTTPTEGNGIVYTNPFTLGATTVVQAMAYGAGGLDSPLSAGTYTVTACPPPVFTTQPGSVSACPGTSVRLVAAATGSGLSYQWQFNPGGATFTNIAGATGTSYTTANLAAGNNGNQYCCVVTGTCSAITSAVATVTVLAAPSAVVSGGGAICPGGSATVQAALTGAAPWRVTWSDGVVQSGLTSSPAVRTVSPGATITYKVTGLLDANCTASSGQLSGSATVTLNTAPVFTVSPASTTACAGAGVRLVAAVTGTGAVYQWQVSVGGGAFTNVPGATGSSYTTPALGTTNNGNQYCCVSTGTCGAATSGVATLTVLTSPGAVVSGGGAICPGGSTTVQAALSGTAPWQVTWADGVVQSGVLSSPVTRSVSPTVATTYKVTALIDANCSAPAGQLTGSAAVSLNTAVAITTQPVSLSACPGTGARFVVAATGTSVTFQWQVSAGGGAFTNLPGATGTSYTTPSLTAAFNGYQYCCVATGTCGAVTSAVATLTVLTAPSAVVSGGAAICPGGSTTVQAALTGSGPWQVTWSDGVVQSGVLASPAVRTVSPGATTTYKVTGLLDANCTASSGQLSGTATVTLNTIPVFTVSPFSTTACAGTTVRLVAAVTGTGTGYQWQVSLGGGAFTNVPGATSSSYTTPALAPANNGNQYCCVSIGTCGAATSGVATLTVLTAPGAVVSGGGAICPGGSTTVQAALGGTAPWQVTWADGVVQSGVLTSPVTRTVSPSVAMTYKVTGLLDANCSAPSGQLTGSAAVTLNTAPAFTTQPVSLTGCAGGGVRFVAAATGTSVGYQWQVSPAGGSFTNLPGATGTSYTTPSLTAAYNGWRYCCVATGTCGALTSAVATLTVNPQPAAVVSGGGTNCAGTGLVVQAALTGTAPWQITWSDGAVQSGVLASPVTRTVTPAATTTYTITGLLDANCTASAGGLTGKAVATVTTPPAITSAPVGGSLPAGTNVTFSVTATGTAPLTYQWQFNGANVSGATAATYTLAGVTTNSTGSYSVSIANGCGSVTSAAAALTVTNCTVPVPWVGVDVGSVGLAGGQCSGGSTLALEGSGAALNSTADQFHFLYQTITDDGSLVAQLTGQSGSSSNAFAGIMIRETTAAGAQELLLARQGNGSVIARSRVGTGSPPTTTAGGAYTPPNCWLQLVRSGSSVTASVSSDGTTWTTVASVTLTMASNVTLGLFTTSGINTTLDTDTFANVILVP